MRPLALLLCPLVLVAALRAAEPSPEPDDDNDAKKILGTWQPIKAVKGTTAAPADEIAKAKVEVTKDGMTFIGNGVTPDARLTYKLDTKAKPRAIDLLEGKRSVLGIYKIEKDELTILFGDPGGARPKAFDEKGRNLLVFRKIKAKK